MKKIALIFMALFCMMVVYADNSAASIKFEKVNHDFGKFSSKNPVVKCEFKFTNTGDAPLIINQAMASCGCTIPSYSEEPIKPGEQGSIKVVYNGTGRFPGHFKKSITILSNASKKIVKLTIEGEMYDEE